MNDFALMQVGQPNVARVCCVALRQFECGIGSLHISFKMAQRPAKAHKNEPSYLLMNVGWIMVEFSSAKVRWQVFSCDVLALSANQSTASAST